MDKRIKIAFDLDGVIIDKPPLVPKVVIEWLFRGLSQKKLHYRFPRSKIEQLVRKLSHYYLFRPPIKENIKFINFLSASGKYEIYIISARYSFLKEETENWLKKRNLKSSFKKIYLNLKDEQPHLYKEKILREIKPGLFVDDDPLLADYLAEKVQNTQIFCYSSNPGSRAKNISSLKELI